MDGATVAQSVYDFSQIDTSMVLPTIISICTTGFGIRLVPALVKKGFGMIFHQIKRA